MNGIMIVGVIIATVVLLISIFKTWRIYNRLADANQTSFLMSIWPQLAIGLFLFFLTFFFREDQLPPDYIALNRPSVSATFKIESVNNNRITFRSILHNHGPLDAFDVRCMAVSTSAGIPFHIEILNDLPKGSSISCSESILPAPRSATGLSMELTAFFSAKISGETKTYKTVYNFSIGTNSIAPGSFDPWKITFEEGVNARQEMDSTLSNSGRLDTPEGSVYLVFNENQKNPNQKLWLQRSRTKGLIFDPVGKSVSLFRRYDTTGVTKELFQLVPSTPNGYHLVSIHWGPVHTTFGLDGREIRDSAVVREDLLGDRKPWQFNHRSEEARK